MAPRKQEDQLAPLFTNGGSQAVRLPREFRFEGSAVRIRKIGDAVILEPLKKRGWPSGFWQRLASLGRAPDDLLVPEPLPRTPRRDRVLRQLDSE
ncbi:MAG: AbrB/MazE/SpoVT family DNA-binding domain-containing protein [Gemmatimonadaceae bacterium]